jgi:hypothetical protein
MKGGIFRLLKLTLPRKGGVGEKRSPELFERARDKEKRTAARTTWEKKHADYITFAFDFALT